MTKSINQFKKDWKIIRGRTIEFLKSVPKEKVSWSPHKDLGTIGMQIRHMCTSQEAYITGIKKGKIDFSDKYFDPKIEKNIDIGLKCLDKLDKELSELIEKESLNKELIFIDGIEGSSKITLQTALDYLMNHEFYHQGIFTCYGRLLNLGKFKFM